MRLVPPINLRREIVGLLRDYYAETDRENLDQAIRLVCGYYGVKLPTIRWRKRICNGQALGLTWDDGRIDLIPPRIWEKRRSENTEAEWVATILHELGHHVLWADAEAKADRFARGILEGV